MKNKLKFISFFVVSFVFMFISIINVKAIKITITGPDKVDVGKNITLKFEIAEFQEGNTGNIDISWDPKDLVSWDCPSKEHHSITKNESFTCVFTGKKDGEVTINANTNYNGDGADAAHKIVVGNGNPTPPEPTPPAPTTTTTNTSSTTTTTIANIDPNLKSDNANLKTLKITDKGGNELKYTPAFSPTVYAYKMDVDSSVNSINIDVTLEDEKSNVMISNNIKELVAGENNEVNVTVTSESGIKKVYKIDVKRQAQDPTTSLATLEIKEVPNFKLEEGKYSYDVNVEKDINELTINYTTTSESASVEVQGNKDLQNGSKVKIIVIAEDGSKREYTINIVKETDKNNKKVDTSKVKTEKNPIIIMVLSIIAFSLIGLIIHVIRKK